MPVVCNSSPEGYIPESSDDCDDSFVESDQSSKAQRILVYSWRTMREIMLLLSEIANQTVTLENVLEMLPEECLLRIGDFFMDVFIETKHRGVFEQANNAFTSICRCFFHSKNENLNSLPVKWIEQALDLCTGKVTDERLCATRRSAGLPFLILVTRRISLGSVSVTLFPQSILPILSDKDHELLKECVNPMFAAAEGDNDEFRMHCLNVLRFVFRNGKLSEAMVPHVDRAAITALRGFNSRAWGVRNSATLLLAALVTRIFGAPSKVDDEENDNTNKITLAVFHLRYRNLFNFLFEKLEEECDRVDSLILHPVLLILSKLFPSNNEEVNEKVSKYIPCIDRCITNSSYRTRDLAARASVSLMSESRLLAQLNENFNRIANANITDTECQGLLLQVRHIFQTMIYDQVPITHYLMQSKFLLAQVGQRFSHFTVTLYMDIVYMLLTK
ncbi:hypothetical protein GEV33_006635 [Tenebrio molitor]|uniref:tRNA (32-2'-O)-methyltransferase regulator THADA n=3 Tax=Tenebrio molitor TaxID=7067 RepID=A0A8J6LJI4_TENMO|nr:hypothetical protein GEV33_006635 [Tenebrio molitor]